MSEHFSNNATTTLVDPISSTQTIIAVTSSTNFPSPNFRVKIDNEIMLVVAVDGTSWTVQRGVEGSTPALHAASTTVSHVLTAASLLLACQQNGMRNLLLNVEDGSTISFDLDASSIHQVVLGGNRVLAVENASVGQRFLIRLVQDGAGNRTVTWWNGIRWAAGITPTLTLEGNKADLFGFLVVGEDRYDGFTVGQNISSS